MDHYMVENSVVGSHPQLRRERHWEANPPENGSALLAGRRWPISWQFVHRDIGQRL